MSVNEYYLKFTMLSIYHLSLVFDSRDEMSHFVMGVSNDFKEDFPLDTLHYNMNISLLMVHTQYV